MSSTSLSFIKPLSFEISRNVIFGSLSIISLGLFTYLANRYLNNNKNTSNQYYIKKEETILGMPSLNLKKIIENTEIIYLFWNGDMSSTYLLIDLLLQDKIIQPLYIEKYTILKSLEYDNLDKLTKQYNNSLKNNEYNYSNGKENNNLKIKKYLEDVARIKKNQSNEITQLIIIRKMIIKQYPEFQKNLLPTQFIITITKDLSHTSNFFSILSNISPLYYNGIEFLEQVTRFIKYYKPIMNQLSKNTNANISKIHSRILIGYTKDNKNIELIKKILSRNILKNVNIELPLIDMINSDVKYLATSFTNNIFNTYPLTT